MSEPLINYCRACHTRFEGEHEYCPACGDHALLSHPQIDQLTIAHIDCDAFFASVEKRDNPELDDKPVIVGGGQRGVVSTACYIARLYGVRSAMPMFKALELCPDAVVISPKGGRYGIVGRQIRDMMFDTTPLVEPLSIDEAFLDLTGTERLHKCAPVLTLLKLQQHIYDEVGVTVSVGLSHNKFLAKTASELDKPNGFSIIPPRDTLDILAPMSVRAVYGVGPAFAKKLEDQGLRTLKDIRKLSDKDLAYRYGEAGLRLARLSRGEDSRKVKLERVRKSVSGETTFHRDICDLETLKSKLWDQCVRVADEMKTKGVAGHVVTLKLKTADFKSLTRRRTLSAPAQLADTLYKTACPLLEVEPKGRYYRLIGVGYSDLVAAQGDVGDLLDPNALKRAAIERASDAARAKFGKDIIQKGLSFKSHPPKKKTEP